MNPTEILLYPLMGEKATVLREKENKLTFIVHKEATKEDVRKAISDLYKVDVLSVNSMITSGGRKKAIIKLSEKVSAEEIASKFGVL